jgi:predicted TIM-barrel fold metal-dependent hydrolase
MSSGSGAPQLVIDADAHVVEGERTWEYLDASEEKFRPRIAESVGGGERFWLVNGQVAGLRTSAFSDEQYAAGAQKIADQFGRNALVDPAARRMDDVKLRLRHMTELGIDIQVLHNSIWIESLTDRPDVEYALVRSWNRWLADIWTQGEGRLRWTCLVPVMSPAEVPAELAFAKENGAVGVCIRPFEGGLSMVDEGFHPLYQAAQDLDLPIIIHIANADPQLVRSLTPRYLSGVAGAGIAKFHFPTVLACYQLFWSGLPKIFPELRWGFIEAAAQWVPWMLNLVDEMGFAEPGSNPFVANNVYVSTQTNDDIAYIVKCVGNDTLVLGTDYGHMDPSGEIDAITKFKGMGFGDDVVSSTLTTNPARLYGLGV